MNFWRNGEEGAVHWRKGYEMLLAGTFSEYYREMTHFEPELQNDALAHRLVAMRQEWGHRGERPMHKGIIETLRSLWPQR